MLKSAPFPIGGRSCTSALARDASGSQSHGVSHVQDSQSFYLLKDSFVYETNMAIGFIVVGPGLLIITQVRGWLGAEVLSDLGPRGIFVLVHAAKEWRYPKWNSWGGN